MSQSLSPAAQDYAAKQAAERGMQLLRDQLSAAPEAEPSPDIERAPVQGKSGKADAPDPFERDASDPGPDPDAYGAEYAPPEDHGGGSGDRSGGRPRGQIWDGCPVQPLGVAGELCFYLDVHGQLRGIETHSADKIRHLFGGREKMLRSHFPQYNKDGSPKSRGFDQGASAAAMVEACSEIGVWYPTGNVRGPGAWSDDDGNLVVHAGDEVLIGGTWQPPGLYQGKIYTADRPAPRPGERRRHRDAGPGARVLELLSSWKWRRPDIDPHLMLGLICVQMMGGALDWRPVGWLTGDAATGKSTLQKLLLYIHGGETGLLQAADATEAGIRSVVGYSSLPVAIDELEPDQDEPRKVKAVIELARRAASGAQIFRGSSDQKGYQSNAYSAFLFSSILIPPLPGQDRSRLVQLDLDRIDEGAERFKVDARAWRALGADMRRLLIDGWATRTQRMDLYRGALAKAGHNGRGCDNFGTLLALADIVTGADLPDASTLDAWSNKLSRAVTEESTEIGSNAEDMLTHLLSQEYDVFRAGERYTVAQFVMAAADLPGAPLYLRDKGPQEANRVLGKAGLRVTGRREEARLQIANKPLGPLVNLFAGSPWAGGVWAQATRRLPGAQSGTTRFAGIGSKYWSIGFDQMPGLMAFPADGSGPSAPLEATVPDLEDFE